jgi:zinc protease
MKKLWSLLVLAVVYSTANAQYELIEKVEPSEDGVDIPYEKWKLTSNDLTLIIHEDHSDPIVHVQVAYHVGSARESVRNSGFAHFFEHMMFQGSKHVEDEEHFKIISEAGGTNNAFTSFDKTVYINTAPSNATETLLWLEADRMGTHLDGFTQKKFENQRDAVKNEKRQRYDNQPYGMLNEELFKTMFPNHPYEWTPIGYVDDLDAADYDDLRNFFLRWYGPNNATLVVSGDCKPEEVKAWVAKYFGGIQKCPAVRKPRAAQPIIALDRYVKIPDNVWLPLTTINYPTVPEFHKDEPALDMLSVILGGNRESILYRDLQKSEFAVQANASHSTLELSGLFSVSAVVKNPMFGGPKEKEVEAKIREAFKTFEKEGITDKQMEIAKAQFKTGILSGSQSVSGKALQLSHWHMMTNGTHNVSDDLERYEAVTKEDVMRVYNKYIKNRKAVITYTYPQKPKKGDDEKPKSVNPHAGEPKKVDPQYVGLEYVPPKDDFDRSVRPELPPAPKVKVPDYYTTKFDNGMQIIGTESNESPMVYLYFDMEGGHLLEANKKVKVGSAFMTAAMMGEGTKNKTAEEFEAALNILGSRISFNSGTYNTSVFVSSTRENLDATLALFYEALSQPRFDEDDFDRIQDNALSGARSQKLNPSVLAGKAYNSLVFKGTVLADYYTGGQKDIAKLKLKDVIEFHENYYSPNLTKVVVSGNISQDEALKSIEFLKDWKSKDVDIPSIPQPEQPKETTIYLIDKPYAAQSVVLAGFPSIPYDYKGDFYKNQIMNFALGGTFNSRINLNLREDKGYTYGARASFTGNEYIGQYRFFSNIKKEATDSAIAELVKEIENYKANGITEEELEFTKKSITSSEALNYETPIQKLNFLSQILDYNLSKNYTAEQAEIVKNITQEEINALAKKYLNPENMVIIVIGHAYKVKPGLERLGYDVETIEAIAFD